jgi:general secretion pathway protein K
MIVKSEKPEFTLSPLANDCGFALMMVLWFIVLLSIIAMDFTFSTRWNFASTRNLKDETRSYYLCMTGYQEALQYIMSDKDQSVDFIDSDGVLRIDSETPHVAGIKTTGDGDIDIRITDEESKININFAGENGLKKLFGYAGLPSDSANELTDSILDWIDPDSMHHISGAEDKYYEGLEKPYTAKNGFFSVPEELLLVKGMLPEYMTGTEDIKALGPLITTFGRRGDMLGAININTASKEILEILGLNPLQIEAIIKQREDGGFKNVQSIPFTHRVLGLTSTSSLFFRIEVSARANGSGQVSHIVAVINRTPLTKGYKLKTVYWKEYAESYRG